MLFFIDASVADNIDDHDCSNSVEDLISSYRHGDHYVIADERTLRKLINCEDLNKQTKAVIKDIHTNLPKNMGLLDLPITRCRIIYLEDIFEKSLNGDSLEIVIPVRFYLERHLHQKPVLLCENLNDCEVFTKLAKVYNVKYFRIQNLRISMNYQNGGGSTISQVYLNLLEENDRFCFCILDSDKKSPGDRVGDTASRVISCNSSELCNYKVLECREVENLFPPLLLSESFSRNQNIGEFASMVETIYKDKDTREACFYIDVKNGLKIESLFSLDGESFRFWRNVLRKLNITCDCLDTRVCDCDQENCKCLVIPGLGRNTLSTTVGYLNQITPHKLANFYNSNEAFWDRCKDICLAILSLGFAPGKRFVN